MILVLFFGIAAAQFWVGHQFGAAWRFISALAGLLVWLLIRPWRLALLSQESRREVFSYGTGAFAGWLVCAAFFYWRHYHAA